MNLFRLHPTLVQDCHVLGRLSACHVLLMRNRTIPWMILVPQTRCVNLFDLEEAIRFQVFSECGHIAGLVRAHFSVSRINFAQIGNLVPQLHLHVVGRREDDPCWPAPVWGRSYPCEPYSVDQLRDLDAALHALSGFTPDRHNF